MDNVKDYFFNVFNPIINNFVEYGRNEDETSVSQDSVLDSIYKSNNVAEKEDDDMQGMLSSFKVSFFLRSILKSETIYSGLEIYNSIYAVCKNNNIVFFDIGEFISALHNTFVYSDYILDFTSSYNCEYLVAMYPDFIKNYNNGDMVGFFFCFTKSDFLIRSNN